MQTMVGLGVLVFVGWWLLADVGWWVLVVGLVALAWLAAKVDDVLKARASGAASTPFVGVIDLPERVQFTYMNNEGEIRERTVNVNQVDRPGSKFTGFCETAGGVRTFKADSILGPVTRHETGEIVPAMDWYQALKPAASKRSKK
jgi:hypothetical protein